MRQGDIFGDATVGPYFGFQGSWLTLLATAGSTQVSVKDVSTGDQMTETGITVAGGVVFSISKDFDIAAVVGVDHLSGNAAKSFAYQNSPWVPFAIGYKFTK